MDNIETIEFATPDRARRAEAATVEVDLIGRTYTVHKPKDMVRWSISSVLADTSNEADRWWQVLGFVEAVFKPEDRKNFYDRACDRDDPLTAGAVWDMVGQLLARWDPESKIPSTAAVVVEAHDNAVDGLEPVRITNDDLDLDLTCYPPKDLILGITASSLAARASIHQQAWAVPLFLDAALDNAESLWLSHRLKAPAHVDDIDVTDIVAIVDALLERWYAPARGNRATRRAKASATRKQTKKTSARTAAAGTSED